MGPTFLAVKVTLLNEASERRQTCSWTNHDDWGLELEGQTELRFAHVYWHLWLQFVRDSLVIEPVGGHTFLSTSVLGLVLDDCACHMNGVGELLKRDKRDKKWVEME